MMYSIKLYTLRQSTPLCTNIPTHKYAGPILDSEGMGAFLGARFSEKRAFWLLAPP